MTWQHRRGQWVALSARGPLARGAHLLASRGRGALAQLGQPKGGGHCQLSWPLTDQSPAHRRAEARMPAPEPVPSDGAWAIRSKNKYKQPQQGFTRCTSPLSFAPYESDLAHAAPRSPLTSSNCGCPNCAARSCCCSRRMGAVSGLAAGSIATALARTRRAKPAGPRSPPAPHRRAPVRSRCIHRQRRVGRTVGTEHYRAGAIVHSRLQQ